MNWQGKWIWLSSPAESDINLRVLARKTFSLQEVDKINSALLRITADTQYRLCVNGKWVNDGPTRAFPWKYSYDQIDIAKYLKAGKNVLSAWIQHNGEGTFYQIATRPGLLAELEIKADKKTQMIVSDESWKIRIDPAHIRWTPRISCQMPPEEQYDARTEICNWNSPDYNDENWPNASVVASVAEGPWKSLTQRDIPLLDYHRVLPVSVPSMRAVKAPNFIEGINVKRALWPERIDANRRQYCGAILTCLHSPIAQKVTYHPLTISVYTEKYFLNGKAIRMNGHQELSLKKGINYLLVVFDLISHFDDFTIALTTKKPLTMKSPVCKGKWALAGPFEQGGAVWERLLKAKTYADLEKGDMLKFFCEPPFISPIGSDVYARVINQQTLPASVKTKKIENLIADNQEYAIIEPQSNDVELLIDFGQEYNAHVELDLVSPAGVTIDAHCFEAMVNGESQYVDRNRSGFRYVTKEGPQKYTTYRHFGFRYMTLTLRNIKKPIKIRNVRAHFVHHQVEHNGKFHCDDYLLNTIWDIGKHTLLCCMEDTFTDCPTYEQTCWVGDARNESLVCHTAFGQYDMTRRCANLTAASLKRSSMTESQVPSAWQNIIPVWSFLWVQMCWEHYYYTGELSTLRSLYSAVKKMLNNIQKKYVDPKTGLFSIAGSSSSDDVWHFFDWTPIDCNHKTVAFESMFLVSALQVANKMADELGKKTEARNWKNWACDLSDNINKHFWSNKLGGYVDSIHDDGEVSKSVSRPTNTLAILYDIATPQKAKKIMPIVLGDKTKDIIPFGSPFALFFLLECLVKLDRFDDVVKIVREDWGDMVNKGATSFWEQLGSTRSHCHAWSSAPTYFLSTYVLGVRPTSPGFKTIMIEPNILDLKFTKGQMPTPSGNITVSWKRSSDEFTMTIEKPAGVAGKLKLPAELKIDSAQLKINGRKASGNPNQGYNLPAGEKVEIVAKIK